MNTGQVETMQNPLQIVKAHKKNSLHNILKYWQLYLLIVPAAILYIVFRYIPMFGLILAFKDYQINKGFFNSPWVGLKHFHEFISYYRFGQIFLNTISLSIYKLIAFLPFPIILAVALNEVKNVHAKKLVQTVTYAPYFISVVVIVGITMQVLSPQVGVVNHVIGLFGGAKVNFIAEPSNFRHIFVWTDVWQNTGYTAILYIASLASIDPSIYEAAFIDGANKWQKIIKIDLPSILPTVVIMLILQTGSIMEVSFEKAILLQNSVNLSTSEVLSTYLYKAGILEGRFDFATAGTMFNSVINFTLIIIVNQIARKVGETSLW